MSGQDTRSVTVADQRFELIGDPVFAGGGHGAGAGANLYLAVGEDGWAVIEHPVDWVDDPHGRRDRTWGSLRLLCEGVTRSHAALRRSERLVELERR